MRVKDIFSAAAVVAVVVAVIAAGSASGQDAEPYADPYADPDQVDGQHAVYYQVVYGTDDIRDLDAVPTTNEGIKSVLRISRTGSAVGAYERIHTGDPTVREVAAPHVSRQYLRWNGAAWVGPARPRPAEAGEAGGEGHARAVSREFDRTEATLDALEARLGDWDHIVAQLERQLDRSSDADQKAEIEDQLADARDRQQEIAETVEDYRRRLSVLRDVLSGGGELLEESGQVRLLGVDSEADDSPSVREVTLDHRVQVWRVRRGPGDTGRRMRTYEVSIPHAVAGAYGAFYYVAYADTIGDGKPDTLIAQSPLASAAQPGQWTTWTFSTDEPDVFVGNAWPSEDTSHYVVTPFSRRGSTGATQCPNLEQIAHIGGIWWEGPGATDHRFGAYLTNIHLRVIGGPDPDAGAGRFDSGIVEK